MKRNLCAVTSGLRLCLPLVAAALFASSIARAQVLIAAQDVPAVAGSTGDVLDVTLTNLGPSPVDIAAFAFELTVASTDITFTDVTTATAATYIFAGNSLFGPSIGIPVTNQDIMASDLSSNGVGTDIAAGATVGLGHLIFNVSSAASGLYPIVIVPFPNTSLSDANGGNITFTTSNGSVTVTGRTTQVPEPGTVALLAGLAIPGIVLLRRRK